MKQVWSGTLYGRDAIPYRKDFSNLPDSFSEFKAQLDEGIADWKSQADEAYPAPVPGTLALPARSRILIPEDTPLGLKVIPQLQSESDLDALITEGVGGGPKSGFNTKELSASKTFKGGERVALKRMQKYDGGCEKSTVAKGYATAKKGAKKAKPPAPALAPWLAQLPPGLLSTKLSPWLSAGCISPRMVGHYLIENGLAEKPIAQALTHELMVRDYLRFSCAKNADKLFEFVKNRGGDDVVVPARKTSPEEDALFDKWKDGRTGMPLIDAAMRELAATGWMSARARLNAATYLVGQLGVNWRRGGDYFESLLVDYDICSNWGNWAILGGVMPGANLGLDPVAEGKEYDPEGAYVKYWVKELKSVPADLVHEWWKMSPEQMAKYRLKPGDAEGEYPVPPPLKLRRSLAELPFGGGGGAPRRREGGGLPSVCGGGSSTAACTAAGCKRRRVPLSALRASLRAMASGLRLEWRSRAARSSRVGCVQPRLPPTPGSESGRGASRPGGLRLPTRTACRRAWAPSASTSPHASKRRSASYGWDWAPLPPRRRPPWQPLPRTAAKPSEKAPPACSCLTFQTYPMSLRYRRWCPSRGCCRAGSSFRRFSARLRSGCTPTSSQRPRTPRAAAHRSGCQWVLAPAASFLRSAPR